MSSPAPHSSSLRSQLRLLSCSTPAGQDFSPAREPIISVNTSCNSSDQNDQANEDALLAWEKLPQALRSSFSNATLAELSKFPADWPEVEYIPQGVHVGYNRNIVRDTPRDGYNYATVLIGLVAPLSRGTIDISSADMADPPLIDPNWLTHPADQAVAVAAYKRVRQLFHTTAMQPVLIGPEYFPGEDRVQSDEEILELIRESFNTIYHASSTCAMGRKEDPNAVVDSKARVIGVRGLRVVDASTFPFLPPGHPQATVCKLFPFPFLLRFHLFSVFLIHPDLFADGSNSDRCTRREDRKRHQNRKVSSRLWEGFPFFYILYCIFFCLRLSFFLLFVRK